MLSNAAERDIAYVMDDGLSKFISFRCKRDDGGIYRNDAGTFIVILFIGTGYL